MRRIYMLDFGLARQYTNANGEVKYILIIISMIMFIIITITIMIMIMIHLGMPPMLERGGRPGPRLIPRIPIITRPRLMIIIIIMMMMIMMIKMILMIVIMIMT